MSAVIDALNRYSADWTGLVVGVVWQTTLLALAIGAIAYFLRFSSPAVRYWLWQIVAIKLLRLLWAGYGTDLPTAALQHICLLSGVDPTRPEGHLDGEF